MSLNNKPKNIEKTMRAFNRSMTNYDNVVPPFNKLHTRRGLQEVDGFGGGNYIITTFQALSNLVNTSQLEPLAQYVIEDFQTIYNQPVTDDLKFGSIEPLVVVAASESTLQPQAYSLVHPKDIIIYDITINETFVSQDPAKGRIMYRKDELDNEFDFDFREVLNYAIDGSGEFLTFQSYSTESHIDYNTGLSVTFGIEFPNTIFKDFAILNKDSLYIFTVFKDICFNNRDCVVTESLINGGFAINQNINLDTCELDNVSDNYDILLGDLTNSTVSFTRNSNLRVEETTFSNNLIFTKNSGSTRSYGLQDCDIVADLSDRFSNNHFETIVVNKTITETDYPELFDEDTFCTIYKLPNGNIYYRYYDNTNTLIQTQIV